LTRQHCNGRPDVFFLVYHTILQFFIIPMFPV
jgi:hypothetical protein